MIRKISKDERYRTNYEWSQSYFLFSFDRYFDPSNINHGALRVFNDDVIFANSGFPAHPHADMEIVTLVHSGRLLHEDNLGNKKFIQAGEIQAMSAGTGIAHSEMNPDTVPVHLYQLWFLPRTRGVAPSYRQATVGPLASGIKVLASGYPGTGEMLIDTEARVSLGRMKEKESHSVAVREGWKAFVYVSNGKILINGIEFSAGDQVRLTDEPILSISAAADSDFILIEAGNERP